MLIDDIVDMNTFKIAMNVVISCALWRYSKNMVMAVQTLMLVI